STIAGLRAMENRNFRAAAMEGVIATYNRNRELGK
ncbi:MAG: pyrroline-5-carboxylate reductase, partial [Peptococcaceae bacterium]|nr:pyrroline-5-carboxylate reductase [Peptococcaceae bacterium]